MKKCILCTVDGTKFDLPEDVFNSVQNFIANPEAKDYLVIHDIDGTIITLMRPAISYLYDYVESHANGHHQHAAPHIHGEGCNH